MRLSILILCAASLGAADLPVTEVILYKNGVGYFQRAGELAAGESARLEFKAEHMNDVLKSFRIVEEGGGKVTALRYDSSEPLEARLAEFPFQYGKGAPLAAFLDQLRGARVELAAGGQRITGLIVAARESAAEPNRPRKEEVTVMLDSGELRVLDLSGLTSIRFPDPKLETQLRDFLATLAGSRDNEKRSVYIDSTDSKARRVRALYVVPVPAWKSSYRLALRPQGGEPVLEGWAIVDNTSGEDWTKVTLAVVSGKPVSFVTNLYEPRYVERAAAEMEEMAAAKPKIYGGAVGGVVGGVMADTARSAAPPPPPPAPARVAQYPMQITPGMLNATSSVVATTIAREAGELFEYRFESPVTIRKGESAMLPFVQQPVGARKLLIYSAEDDEESGHPRNAVEITNGTGKTLDGGPITVFDSGSYAGEALMDTLKTGDRRLISYAIDLGTRVEEDSESSRSTIREAHFRRGILTTRSAERTTTTYSVTNADAKPKTVIIEHPIEEDTKLVSPKPVETAKGVYRFELKLDPRGSGKLAVVEDGSVDETHVIASTTTDFLLSLVQNREISDAARKHIAAIADRKAVIARLKAEAARLEQQRTELIAEQSRTRENIMSLNAVAGQQDQVQNYARRLAAGEAEIASLRDRTRDVRQKLSDAEAELARLMDTLEF